MLLSVFFISVSTRLFLCQVYIIRVIPDCNPFSITVGRDSSVGIATRYGLEGQGIESRWGEVFRTRPDRPWGPPSLLYNGYWVSFPGVKRPGRGVDHPAPSSAEVKERMEIYLNYPFGPL
jgi:hypothetical protein